MVNAAVEPPRFNPFRELAGLVHGAASLPRLALERRREGPAASVIVLPGYLAADGSTVALRTYLARRGHRVSGWGEGRNRGDLRKLVPRVMKRVRQRAEEDGADVHLVGWSLGGVIAREVARELPDTVAQVITLGSPVIGGPKYTVVAHSSRRRGLDLDEVEKALARRNEVPLRVPVTALFTKRDGVVAWQACIDPNPENGVRHVEVDTTHVGLPWNAAVLSQVADQIDTLAQRLSGSPESGNGACSARVARRNLRRAK